MKKIILYSFIFLLLPLFVSPTRAFQVAQPSNGGIIVNRTQASGGQISTILKNTISLFFVVAGIGVVIMFLWGAVDWILSGGDKEKVAGARKKITNALIGLFVLAITFAVMIVIGQLLNINILTNLVVPKFNP
jgi:hypothetical protein